MRRTSTKDGFFNWIAERHRVWQRRAVGLEKPWTDDEIMRRYKFTNVFRELDTGTLALRGMIPVGARAGDKIFNVAWYRMFNRAEHATDIGFCETWTQVRDAILQKVLLGRRVFTGCHMHNGDAVTNLASLIRVYESRYALATDFRRSGTLRSVFNAMKEFRCVGPFISYEMACDLRFELTDVEWTDVDTWANVGPGSSRGLQRLGMRPTVESMVELLSLAPAYLSLDRWRRQSGVPFELREIEHSLCEFDKYERARLGEGVPKQRYDGA